VTIVQENGYGLVTPSGCENEIWDMVAVDIPRSHLQPTCGRDDPNGLRPGRCELKLDPVICERKVTSPCLNDC